MEASQQPAAESGQSSLSIFDRVGDASQQPIEAQDQHGSVTPRSAPPAGPHAGIDPATGQATVPPQGGGAAGVGAGGAQ